MVLQHPKATSSAPAPKRQPDRRDDAAVAAAQNAGEATTVVGTATPSVSVKDTASQDPAPSSSSSEADQQVSSRLRGCGLTSAARVPHLCPNGGRTAVSRSHDGLVMDGVAAAEGR